MASTANSQTTSQPTIQIDTVTGLSTDTGLVYPFVLRGQQGAFITEHAARKIVADYARLRFYRATNKVLHQQVATYERLKASQEAENRSLQSDLADAKRIGTLYQQNAGIWQGKYEAERTNNRKTIVRAVVITVSVAVITGLLGFGYGRLSK